MTVDDLETLSALRRRLTHAEAIARIAAENGNDLENVSAAVARVSVVIEEAGLQLDAIITANLCL